MNDVDRCTLMLRLFLFFTPFNMNRDMDKGLPDMQPMPSHHDVNKILETYFLKKGYSQSELAYIQESSDHNIVSLEQLTKKFHTSPTLPNHVQLIKKEAEQGGGDLDATMCSYQSLREWIFNALDLYKVKEFYAISHPTRHI